MRSGRFRYSIVASVAAIALAVTVTVPPAQAGAEPVSTTGTAPAHSLTTPAHLPVHRGVPWSELAPRIAAGTAAPGSYGPYYLCFYRDNNYCAGANANPETLILLGHVGDTGWAVLAGLVIWWLIKKSGGGGESHRMQVNAYSPKNPGGWPTGKCIGVWGYNAHPHLGSCTSQHGIYWEFQYEEAGADFHLWNTYSRGWLRSGQHLSNGESLWAGAKSGWDSWYDR
jgi:hypothetical protein